ncbi:hypothetical protein DICPUDRAFT_83515 [Dictyostelium purpureum]|uniref:Uncharacterized protein n=1 Tax=Dictyostelium purpureum TaxID=5786 RepID=F0ZZR5_DICPU|nr:uncharacterized protein DICPUDRAFT_83515 [Dictyostelium purpureum]EGC30564.1 hypothetical protein DICPUDRAFT_83515 [Dictyostelium purpureum]|eukprot:XP_003292905.1 hypothetical protein DICPUDRAFT_83515 [Dictyostelium purpureum]
MKGSDFLIFFSSSFLNELNQIIENHANSLQKNEVLKFNLGLNKSHGDIIKNRNRAIMEAIRANRLRVEQLKIEIQLEEVSKENLISLFNCSTLNLFALIASIIVLFYDRMDE